MTSLTLDPAAWDLVLDSEGNLALTANTPALLQDVCSAVRTWRGEARYDLTLGVPYEEALSGASPPQTYAAQAENAARQVPGVAAVKCVLSALTPDRRLRGQIAIQTINGETASADF